MQRNKQSSKQTQDLSPAIAAAVYDQFISQPSLETAPSQGAASPLSIEDYTNAFNGQATIEAVPS